jgi:cyclopropane fatty-acyl-phospholipid synthase-like methyltransferase
MLVLVIVALGLIVLAICLIFLYQGPPFVPSSDAKLQLMIRAVSQNKTTKVLDMGCGNGKLVIALTQLGYTVDGVELNPWLVLRARRNIKKLRLSNQAHIYWGSFWSFDVSSYDTVVLYVIAHIMPRLESKLTKELRPGARIISNYFTFPGLKPINSSGSVHTYEIT